MTLEDLNAHLVMLQELITARELLATMRAATLSASRLDETPRAPSVGDRTAALAVKISQQREIVSRYENMVEASSVVVKEYIDSVSNNRLNVILYLRFICGFEWAEVAEVIGGRNNENSVKSLVYRHFRSQAL